MPTKANSAIGFFYIRYVRKFFSICTKLREHDTDILCIKDHLKFL